MPELTVSTVASLPRDTGFHRLNALAETASWQDFRTLAVAAAISGDYCPPALHDVLAQPRFHTDLLDALMMAENDLQVTLLRRRYLHGPQSRQAESARSSLRKIRAELKRLRAMKPPRKPQPPNDEGGGTGWALRRLRANHPAENEAILQELLRRENLPEALHDYRALPLAEQVIMLAIGYPELTATQQTLLHASDDDVRDAVRLDILAEDNSDVFEHPLLAERWLHACQQLVTHTRQRLGSPEADGPQITESELFIPAACSREEAFERIDDFRFLAHVYAALRDAKRAVSQIRRRVNAAAYTTVGALLQEASRALADRHPDEYRHLLDAHPAKVNVVKQQATTPRAEMPKSAVHTIALAHEYGWHADQAHEQTARVTFSRPGPAQPRLRLSYGIGSRHLVACSVQVPGEPAWFVLPNIAELKTLLTMDGAAITETVQAWRESASAWQPRRLG